MVDLGQFALATTSIVGLVNGVKLALTKKWDSFALWLVAVLGGSILGYLHWLGLPSAEIGFALGVSSSGAYELAQRVGGN